MIDLNEIKYHTVTQGSIDWHDLRLARITGTRTKPLTSKLTGPDRKKGYLLNEGSRTLVEKIVSEKITGVTADSDFKNWKMERGNKYEPLAARAYVEEFNEPLEEIGFISCGWMYGVSIDRKGGDRLVEIKCPYHPEFTRIYRRCKGRTYREMLSFIKPEFITQIQWGLLITGMERQDNWYFNPEFPVGHQHVNIIIPRDEETIKILKDKSHIVEEQAIDTLKLFGVAA